MSKDDRDGFEAGSHDRGGRGNSRPNNARDAEPDKNWVGRPRKRDEITLDEVRRKQEGE
jgi:hypothetical protein